MGAMITWGLIFALVGVAAWFTTRSARERGDDSEGLGDSGLAIMEFGRAFPNEAIRSLHRTADGKAVFVRLHDNKAGIMRNMGNHYACHLIEPGTVRVRPLASPNGFAVAFIDAPFHDGDFYFTNPAEAAEVSLWLLGNYVASGDMEPAGVPAAGH